MIKKRFKASILSLTEEIISLVSTGNTTKLSNGQIEVFKNIFGQMTDGLRK